MLRKSHYLALFLAIPFLIHGTNSYAKRMYRWVDENGKVFFSDQVPPDQVQHKRETLNDNARVLDVVEKAKTPEELAQQKRLEVLRKEQEKLIAKQASDDKVLLATYRTVEDLDRAMANKMALMDGEKKMLEGNIERYETQLSQQQLQAANHERNGQKVPEKLLTDMRSTREQIVLSSQEVTRHEVKRQEVEKAFQADKARFEFLTRGYNISKPEVDTQAFSRTNNELGLFVCQDAQECEKAWKIAGDFVYKYASTGRDVETEKLIMSGAPFNDSDMSLSVSRLMLGGDGQQIFLDIRCKSSSLGKELCASEKAKTIRRGFATYIQLQLSSQQ